MLAPVNSLVEIEDLYELLLPWEYHDTAGNIAELIQGDMLHQARCEVIVESAVQLLHSDLVSLALVFEDDLQRHRVLDFSCLLFDFACIELVSCLNHLNN